MIFTPVWRRDVLRQEFVRDHDHGIDARLARNVFDNRHRRFEEVRRHRFRAFTPAECSLGHKQPREYFCLRRRTSRR